MDDYFFRRHLGGVLTAAILAGACLPTASAESWTVTSPNGKINFTVALADLAKTRDYAKGRALYYRIEHSGQTVIADSPLGLTLADADMTRGLRFISASPVSATEELYTTAHGKRLQRLSRHQERTLVFRGAKGQVVELDVRAQDDGVAFRYRLPGGGATATVKAEATGFALPADGRFWAHPSDIATVYAPAYETYYENELAVGTTAPLTNGWAYPMLFRTADARFWGLITEAGLADNFCGTRLSSAAPAGVCRVELPDPKEGNGTGSVYPTAKLPWTMPWRIIILGDSLATVVESTLVEDVCPPSTVKSDEWIKPGRVAWSWWSDSSSPTDGAKQEKFVDFAAEMGWEYVLVDANWTIMDNGTIHDVIRHAKDKGVGVLLWYNSGGPHNIVTEKPRDCFTYKEVRRFEFDMLKKWGVKGVKVDFFQSDKQNVIELYHGILQDAADYQIMVNFHGCTLPRGWSRTYPHLMAMEAIRGAENYIFTKDFPERAPVQNTISPFTRNVVGPMDYTPVAFTAHNHPHRTTYAHELALGALFESGWVHFADKPEAYQALPPEPKEFLKQLPVVWDDTRFVAGYPGRFVVLARRKGHTWYLAGINGLNEPREETLKLGAWLDAGAFAMSVIGDGADAKTFGVRQQPIASGQEFKVRMLPNGGFVATIKPQQ